MPHITFRLDDGEAKKLDSLVKKRQRPKSSVLRGLVVAEVERSTGRGVSKVASEKEVLELLSERARAGNVAAMGRLLDHFRRERPPGEEVPDALAFLDELAPRRKQRDG